MTDTYFDRLGGERALRSIIDRFVDRVFDDTMIGYLFSGVSRERLKAKEYEFAAGHLGAPVRYTGRALKEAHAKHKIMGGQFMRRLQILKEVLQDEKVPPDIVDHWVEHTLSLRSLITSDPQGQCNAPSAGPA